MECNIQVYLSISVGGSMRTVIGVILIGSAHIITPTIGPGVVKLPWAVSHLGWSLAPFVIIIFSIATYYTFTLHASCNRGDDNNIDYTYMDAVKDKLGGSWVILFVVIQGLNIILTAVGYTIAASKSMEEVIRSGCFHSYSSCTFPIIPFMIAFGVVQIILSQIPDFDEIWWLPIVAALMSLTYLIIGLGLVIAKVAENGIRGSLTGATGGEAQKIWTIFQALGNIAYAYLSYSISTKLGIKSPASEDNTLEKAMVISVAATSVLKALCALLGYAAYGAASPENFLIHHFGLRKPHWLVDLANAAVVVHLLIAYQVICQPLFASVEKTAQQCFPDSRFVTGEIPVPIPGFRKLNLFGLFWRTIFVIMTTCMAMLIPFFNDVVGILGELRFWPLTVYFPVEIYICVHGIGKWSRKWIALQTLSAASLIVSILAVLGSVVALVS